MLIKVREHNVLTGEIIDSEREETEFEKNRRLEFEERQAEIDKERKAKAAARQIVLDRLGLTE